MLDARTLDPLATSTSANPNLYVPTESGESALSTIAIGLRAGCSPVLLSGPSGMGKTLLLHVLAEREWRSFARRRYASGIAHHPDELAGALLQLLFGIAPPRRARAAEAALLDELRTDGTTRTLLLVDGIDRESESLVRKLASLARAAKPRLAVVAAGTRCEERQELIDALGAGLSVVLPESLAESEIAALYDSIVTHPGLSARTRQRLERFDRAEVASLAHGVPRRLKAELARRSLTQPIAASESDAEPEPPRPPPAVAAAVTPSEAPLPLPWSESLPPPEPAKTAPAPRPRRVPRFRPVVALRWLLILALAPLELLRDALTRIPVAIASGTRRLATAAAAPVTRAARRARTSIASARLAMREALARSRSRWRERRERLASGLARTARRMRASVTGAAAGVTRALRRAGAGCAAVGRRARVTLAETRASMTRVAEHARDRRDRVGDRIAKLRGRTRAAGAASLGAFERAVRRAGPVAAVASWGAVLVLAGAWLGFELMTRALALREEAPPPVSAAPPIAESEPRRALTPTATPSSLPAPKPPVTVHVNARPWARVWIDGTDLGSTPLRRELPPGTHRLAAEFPDGRRVEKDIDVSRERRFVSLP